MPKFIKEFMDICRNFCLDDVATRRNIEKIIVPRLRNFRSELTMALWADRRSIRPVPRDARRQMIKEVQAYGASVRAAMYRIRHYEAALSI